MMKHINETVVKYFILKGITDVPELQLPIFLLVLLIYLITFGGNMTVLLLVSLDIQLHTAMYFFLGNLSLMDMLSSTVILHKVLLHFMLGNKAVSVPSCIGQLFVFTWLTTNQLLMLTFMSYDRYVAICNPLYYPLIMNRKMCLLLATVSWVLGVLEILPILCIISSFTCYTSNEINHFFCDVVPLIKLTCNDKSFLESYILIEGGLIGCLTPFLFTFISYIFIIVTILRIRNNTGRQKAFYTCSSHITVVVLLYTTISCQYMIPNSDKLGYNKLLSLFNTAAVPMLNPIIYSLKNNEVKSALKRRLRSCEIKW